MKVIKRDGKSVDFDPEKIRIAIGKANAQVSEEEGASDTQIENIIKYIGIDNIAGINSDNE